MWNVRQYLLSQWEHTTVPPENAHLQSENDWRHLVLNAGGQHWHIHLSKKTKNGRKTVNYLGRYLKKPPISGSRLAHYTCGATLSFTYLDHRTQTYQQETLSQADMLRRVVQHIPEKHFRMIRYFGFLANRVCGQYLPKVYEALKMATPGPTPKLYFVQMAKAFLNVDPFRCVAVWRADDIHGGNQRADGAGTDPQRSGDRADEVREALTGGRCVRT
ncbi:hypothetical protein PSE10B_56670 [Pseudomonas amygdali pv. eriobotryae]|nr:hypothetical protein AL057_13445 [Pseudomonas amygdali pv. myricae]GFZ69145.1 hypothetical protein PSE10B_56670 [Pseudomonas amygdali pv. eriobotryae]